MGIYKMTIKIVWKHFGNLLYIFLLSVGSFSQIHVGPFPSSEQDFCQYAHKQTLEMERCSKTLVHSVINYYSFSLISKQEKIMF